MEDVENSRGSEPERTGENKVSAREISVSKSILFKTRLLNYFCFYELALH